MFVCLGARGCAGDRRSNWIYTTFLDGCRVTSCDAWTSRAWAFGVWTPLPAGREMSPEMWNSAALCVYRRSCGEQEA